MDLIRRIARLERRLRALVNGQSPAESEEAAMEYALRVWLVYGQPGEPPPTRPITSAEFMAAIDAVYHPEAAPTPGSAAGRPPRPAAKIPAETGKNR